MKGVYQLFLMGGVASVIGAWMQFSQLARLNATGVRHNLSGRSAWFGLIGGAILVIWAGTILHLRLYA